MAKLTDLTEPLAPSQALPKRYFIADLHLDGGETPRALSFRTFLKRLAAEALQRPIQLYVLGDMFEFWYEYRAAVFELYRADLAALEEAWQAGVQIFVINGNRDFAYGRFARRKFGATVLGDGEQIVLSDSRPAWLEHGDLLCTADWRYRVFRGVVHSRLMRLVFWVLPWSGARVFIAYLRRRSAQDRARKTPRELSIDLEAVQTRLHQTHCRVLLCGHAHVGGSADLNGGGRLLILPAWCDSPGGYVDDGWALRQMQAEDLGPRTTMDERQKV